jgi:ribosomal protein S18 acetylase RimI-like enzyme
MKDAVVVRPMTLEDADAAQAMASQAIADTVDDPKEQEKIIGPSPEEQTRRAARYYHLLETDPQGLWVAEGGGRVVGVSIALKRDGLWALSLLAVDREYRAFGTGRELLARAFAYGDDCRAWMTVSSTHPAAMRSYARLGMQLRPTLWARGAPRVDGSPEDFGVRAGTVDDLDLAATVDLAVRGAAHGPDVGLMMHHGANLLIVDRPGARGYALESNGTPALLAATDNETAADLLRACLARATENRAEADVPWISADQNWAVPVVLDAGLALVPAGCVCVKGETGPLAPYLPNGAFL